MINFLKTWVEQIAIAVIIASIFELIIPKGNIKKYIKIVLGIYVIFCIISPFVDSKALYDLSDFNFTNTNNLNQTEVKQETMDKRLQELYIQELEENITNKVEEFNYKVKTIKIDADLLESSSNPGIHKITLNITKQNIAIENVEEIEINVKSQENQNIEENEKEIEQLKEDLANYYEIDKDIIIINEK